MGLVGLSNVLSIEGSRSNILPNVICPVARTRLTEDLLGAAAERLAPEYVTPLVVRLASGQNERTHEIYSVGGGRYARIFVGLAQGWASDEVPTVEALAANMDQVRDESGYLVPDSALDELKLLGASLVIGQACKNTA